MSEESEYIKRKPRAKPKVDYPKAKRGRKPKNDVNPYKGTLFTHKPEAIVKPPENIGSAENVDGDLF